MGAGVDALLQREMRADLPIVRLNDAGMGVQMAEFVCHALIRHTRDFALFETQALQGLWQEPPALDRVDFLVGILGLGVLGGHVARAVQQFEFPVSGRSRTERHVDGVRCLHGQSKLADFFWLALASGERPI